MQNEIVEKVLQLAIAIQQIPAPTFQEQKRAKLIYDEMIAEGLSQVGVDESGNVYGCLEGGGDAAPVIVLAHLDTVFPQDLDLTFHRDKTSLSGPGIGDNAIGLAGMFGLLWTLQQKGTRLPGNLWLVATVGEEGLGDLRGMRTVVKRLGERVTAYIVLEGIALGHVYHRGLAVRRYRIRVNTAGGHSWVNYGSPSAVHVLAQLVTRMASLPLPTEPRTTLNVGIMRGGISVNTIAPEASLELDLRSEDENTLHLVATQVECLVADQSQADVHTSLEVVGERPAGGLPEDHPLVRLACACLLAHGVQPQLNIGSTDANIPLSYGLRSVCVGITKGSGAHTTQETIQIRPIARGIAQLADLVEGAFLLQFD